MRSQWNPIIVDRSLNSLLSNWLPRSVTMCNGTPKQEIHVFKKANVMVEADVFCKGVGFHPSYYSINACKYISSWRCVYVVVGGNGPMMSI